MLFPWDWEDHYLTVRVMRRDNTQHGVLVDHRTQEDVIEYIHSNITKGVVYIEASPLTADAYEMLRESKAFSFVLE